MSWSDDPLGFHASILESLARGVAEREFGDLIARGVGTKQEFATLFLVYTRRHPDLATGDAADHLRRELLQWLIAREGGRDRPTIRELPTR